MLASPEEDRDLDWLKQMVQFAVQLEFATIPPYLTAFWSVKDTSTAPAPNVILVIVLQEMLHMGIVCNLLSSLGQTPVIASPGIVPKYPGPLPGGVHPTLQIELKPLSKDLIAQTFMTIEEPESGSVRFALGQTYPTIGAFYTAIQDCIRKLPGNPFTGTKQLTIARPDFELTPITCPAEAIAGLALIKEQGEGESGSPLYGPNPDDLAHYYLFGELYHEKALVQVSPNNWQYTGDAMPFPAPDEIYPMAPIPAGGYPQSLAFDKTFTQMLGQLQQAWTLGGTPGAAQLTLAQETMGQLGQLAVELMQTPVTTGSPHTMAPCFRFVSS
ncbi:MAG TPA: ferritin-like protein [Gemmataceae bacterium]|nr:ferritin-like protein [Gemmataceae bacterium]